MFETMLFVAFISAGVVITLHSFLIRRRPERAAPMVLERPLFEVLDLDDPAEVAKTLGRLRLIYGLFFIVMGVWGLLG